VKKTLYSILDLAPIRQGGNAATAFRNALDLAQHAEQWGYHRYWLAEHHNIPGIASAATSVVIGYVAGGTSRIRVGSGGIMLPNHAPLVIAEQFGTLESLYPGRIDLGLGRAPGGDQLTTRALRRGSGNGGDTFPQELMELQAYFAPAAPSQLLRAIPGAGLNVPIYLLGSSDFSARLAAELGLPFAFASHFAPDYLEAALDIYRRNFRPSSQLERPHVMIGVNLVSANTDEEATRLFTSLQQMFLGIIRGARIELPPPVETMRGLWSALEEQEAQHKLYYSAVGSPETIRRELGGLIEQTGADEIIATAQIFDHSARLRSFEIAADVFETLPAEQPLPMRL
jgi:luciferase family oxidoreductase group 1